MAVDVFISYSRRDNVADEVLGIEWVSDLHRALAQQLGRLLGRDVAVWRDPRIKGSEPLREVIEARLAEASAMVCVVTPSWLGSKWCPWELDTFTGYCRDQGVERVDGSTRLFKVLTMPLALERHPEPLRDLLGYEFYVEDPDTGDAQELHRAFGQEVQVEYWRRLRRLASELRDLLLAMDGAAAPLEPGGPGIYLAETSGDLKAARESIRSDLVRKGCRVLPDRPLPAAAGELGPVLKGQLAGCALSVHLIGAHRGPPAGNPGSLVEAQLEAAGRAGLRRLLWLPEGSAPSDEAQKRLVQRLRDGSGLSPRDDLIEGSLERLRLALDRARSAMAAEEAAPDEPAAREEGAPPRVYLIHDAADGAAVGPVEDALFERGCEVVRPLFDGDEAAVRREDQESLTSCDAVLIYWGAAGELWRRRRLRDVAKSWGYGRTRELLATAVYVAGPQTPEKARFRSHEALVIPALDEAALADRERDPLEPFFARLEGRAGAQQR